MRYSLSFVSALLGTVLLTPREASACGGCCCMNRGPAARGMPAMPMGNHAAMPRGNNNEYFCPMHPSVVRDTPNQKCPICHMPLAARKATPGKATNGKLGGEDAKISAALGKLSREDQRLAQAQGYCPILQDNRLGSMGTPVKVMIKGQPVFLCCPGCEEEALADPDATLAKVAKLKARAKAAAPQQ